MKKRNFLKLFLIFFALVAQNNLAQSLVNSYENVTIRIVNKITVSVNHSGNFHKEIFSGINQIKKNKRDLLVSYSNSDHQTQNNLSKLNIINLSKNLLAELNPGSRIDLKHIAENERLLLNIEKENKTLPLNTNYFVTIIY